MGSTNYEAIIRGEHEDSDIHDTLAVLVHPKVILMYKGIVHGEDANGVWDIEFPDVSHAVAWANDIMEHVKMRDAVTNLDAPVTLQVKLRDVDTTSCTTHPHGR